MAETDADGPTAIGRRLHAARLAARHYEISSLIRSWEEAIPDPTYRAAESGRRKPGPELVRRAAETFNVSHDFVRLGEVVGGLDAEADAIAALIEQFKRRGFGSAGDDVAFRLRRARVAAGHRSAKAAAEHFGWKVDRYEQHEGRRRSITFDQAIRYATTFGIDPALLLFGTPPPAPLTSAAMIMPTGTDWAWLRSVRYHDRVQWPALMRLDDGRFVQLPSPVVLPIEIVGGGLRHLEAYCIVDRQDGNGGKIFVVAPGLVGSQSMRLTDGRLVLAGPSSDSTPSDPLGTQLDPSNAPLGALIGTLLISPR